MGHGSHKRSKRSIDTELPHHKLLKYSVRGRSSKLKKWLKRDSSLANAVLPDGSTPLHQACRGGHLKVVKQLIKYGANAQQLDSYGCSPGHVAALYGHADILALLLQSHHPPDLDQPDQTGVTIRHLVAASNSSTPLLQYLTTQRPTAAAEAGGGGQGRQGATGAALSHLNSNHAGAQDSSSSGGGGGGGSRGPRSDAEWRARLQEEMSDEDVGGIGWARHRPVLEEEDAAAYDFPGLRLGRDDTWAEQLWREMQQRRGRGGSQLAAFGTGAHAARQAAAAERDKRAAEAASSSAKILREEQAKDADWRARMLAQVQQGKQLQTYAAYQSKWATLEQLPATHRIPYVALPWPADPKEGQLSTEALKQLLLQGCSSAAEVKKRLKLELMRWHPDKFTAKYLGRVVEKDKAAVVAGVQQVAQCLTALLGAAQQ